MSVLLFISSKHGKCHRLPTSDECHFFVGRYVEQQQLTLITVFLSLSRYNIFIKISTVHHNCRFQSFCELCYEILLMLDIIHTLFWYRYLWWLVVDRIESILVTHTGLKRNWRNCLQTQKKNEIQTFLQKCISLGFYYQENFVNCNSSMEKKVEKYLISSHYVHASVAYIHTQNGYRYIVYLFEY